MPPREIAIEDVPTPGNFFVNQPELNVDSLSSFNTDNLMIKVVFIGDAFVGKTSLIHRIVDNTFSDANYQATIGAEFQQLVVKVKGSNVKCALWDMAGSENYRNITQNYFRGTEVALICFALDDKKTFDNLKEWNESLKKNTTSLIAKFVVGCKSDLEKVVSTEDIENFAKECQAEYFETSSKRDFNVINLVKRIVFVGALVGSEKVAQPTITLSSQPEPSVNSQQSTNSGKNCCK